MLKLSEFKFSREVALILFMIFAASSADSRACSIAVNHNYQKNLLVAHAASELNVALSSVTATSLTEYDHDLEGSEPVSHCPLYLISRAKVSFNYSPARYQTCSASVIVEMREFMGEVPSGPILEVTSTNAELACSTSITVIRDPRRLPPIKKPIRIKP
jgi:hypothetical protein